MRWAALPEVRIVEVRSAGELEQAFAIRRAVFVREQGVSEALEIDQRDDEACHLLALRAGEPIGTLRLRWLERGRIAKIERVAVARQGRGSGVGQALMSAALARAEADGATEARLHAQTVAQAFYAKLGFAAFGPVFDEDGIPHIAMRRPLPGRSARARSRPPRSAARPASG
ncbi:MAG TPA: GNAT family N-acetyltransferase [Geminicoccaceae bacterium]|nr:GNAT family N-acetyltransferase [Geminicoccaceae bacterium]